MPESRIQRGIRSLADGMRRIMRWNKGSRAEEEEEEEEEEEAEPVIQTSWILKFPPEIVLLISDLLPPADIAALVLTCKAFYATMGGKSALKFRFVPDQVDLLRRIEEYFPNHLVCYQCGRLHSQQRVRKKYFRSSACYKQNRSFDFGRFSYTFRDLPFTQVQEAMNRYRYGGGEWTESVTSLPYRRKYTPRASRIYARCRVAPHIINGQFMLSVSMGLSSHDCGNTCVGIFLLLTECKQICASFQVIIDHTFELDKTYHYRCPQCPSVIQLTISHEPKSSRVNAIIHVLYNLGDGRTPFDPNWIQSADSFQHEMPILEKITRADGTTRKRDISSIVDADIPKSLKVSLRNSP